MGDIPVGDTDDMLEKTIQTLQDVELDFYPGSRNPVSYTHLDINYPPKRIEYILSDSKVKYLLTDNTQKMYIDNVKCIDMNSHYVREQSGQDLDNINHWDDLLYTIYTSGSDVYKRQCRYINPHKFR